jgi:uncharacterized Zn-binding protein involved in type VI secretion
MADITLKGSLTLMGNLTFDGGKLLVGDGGLEALVEVLPSDPAQCSSAPPVMLPPPPAGPAFPQPTAWIVSSFNKTVKAKTKAVVALGMAMQGQNAAPWPGMMLPSSGNPTVLINGIPINVVGDQAVIFPSGGSASFTSSGQ